MATDVDRYRIHMQDETDSAALYRALAKAESRPELAEVYRRLGAARGGGYAVARPGAVARAGLAHPCRHNRRRPCGQAEGRHHAASGNALRAAVLGANDGLLSNFSLVMGVAGAELAGQTILVTGLAGLLAGAGSMALGEWISVQSSRELYERQIAIEARELDEFPAEEEELALIYQAKGLPVAEARALAGRLMADRTSALDALAREELGIDPAELGGSAWVAAATSFALFAIGAIVPVLPFLFLSDPSAVLANVLVSTIALFLIGAAITLLTGRSVLVSGMRQAVFGLAAAPLTWGVGRIIGVAIGDEHGLDHSATPGSRS
jgi:VIT1/CCC1 family predicted Fe2+/Mn2+ transporter